MEISTITPKVCVQSKVEPTDIQPSAGSSVQALGSGFPVRVGVPYPHKREINCNKLGQRQLQRVCCAPAGSELRRFR